MKEGVECLSQSSVVVLVPSRADPDLDTHFTPLFSHISRQLTLEITINSTETLN